MAEWPYRTLESVTGEDGFAIGPFGSRMKAENYEATGLRVVRGQNITVRGSIEGDFVYVSESFASTLGAALLQPGDIVLPHRGAIGRAALVDDDDLVMSTSLMRLRVDRHCADPAFVAAFLASEAGEREILRFASTVGTPGIGQPLTSLRQVRVPLPPLDEQKRIAGALRRIDDLIAANRQQIERIRELSRSWYSSLLSEATGTQRISEVAEINHLKVKPSHGTLRYIDIASLGDGFVDMPRPIRWADAPSRARIGAMVGSTLWSTVRPNRRAHALLVSAPSDLVVSTGIAVLTPHSIGPAELFAASEHDSFVDQIVSRADGSAYPAVRPSDFGQVEIDRLSPSASKRFERVMWPLWRGCAAWSDEIAELTRIRDELLPLLMSGRVRVGEGT